jgi:hypothetical protein
VAAIIKSIQPVTVTLTVAAATAATAINAVDVANTIILPNGGTSTINAANGWPACGMVSLESSISVQVTKITTVGAAVMNYTVVEFDPSVVVSIQNGAVVISSGASTGATTIAAVSTRAFIINRGLNAVAGLANQMGDAMGGVTITGTTLVEGANPNTSTGRSIGFTVVDLTTAVVLGVQRVVSALTTVATTVDGVAITAVNTSETMVISGGRRMTVAAAPTTLAAVDITLASSILVNFSRPTATTNNRINYASVVSLNPTALQSGIKRGLVTITSADLTGTATIAAVSTRAVLNSWIMASRCGTTAGNSNFMSLTGIRLTLASTAVNGVVGSTTTGIQARQAWYEVIEFSTGVAAPGGGVFPPYKLQALETGVFRGLHPIEYGVKPSVVEHSI